MVPSRSDLVSSLRFLPHSARALLLAGAGVALVGWVLDATLIRGFLPGLTIAVFAVALGWNARCFNAGGAKRRRAAGWTPQGDPNSLSFVGLRDVTWTSDSAGNTVFISPNIAAVYGYTPEEIIRGGPGIWFGQIHAEDCGVVRAKYESLFSGSELFDVEYRIRCKNGAWIWIHDRALAVYERSGVRYADGVFSDITDRKRSQEELEQSRRQLQALFDNTQDGILLADDTCRCVDANPAACALLGLTREKVMARAVGDLFGAGDAAQAEARWRRFRIAGEQSGDLALVRGDAERREVEYHAMADIVPGLHLSVLRDVTEQRRGGAALRASEERYRQLVELSPDAIFVVAEGRFLFANAATAPLFGVAEPAALMGRSVLDFVHSDSQLAVQERMAEAAAGQRTPLTAQKLLRGDGVAVEVELGAIPFLREGQPAVQVVARDVSARKRDIRQREEAEQALRSTQELLAALLDYAPMPICVTDLEGRWRLVNRAWEDIAGLQRHTIVGRLVGEFFPEDATREFLKNNRWAADIGGPVEVEEPVYTAEGARVFQTVKFPVRGSRGEVDAVGGVSIDITERRKSDRRLGAQHAVARILAESEALAEAAHLILQAICEHLGWDMGAIWAVDDESALLRCVQTWQRPGAEVDAFLDETHQRTFGRGDGLPGRIWASEGPVWIPDLGQDPHLPRAECASAHAARSAFGFPIRVGNRVRGVIECFSRHPQPPDEDLLDAMNAIGSQIGQFSERTRAEAAVRESEALKTAIFNSALDGIITMSHEGRIVDFNPAAERIFGRPREQVVGCDLAELLLPVTYRARHRNGLARCVASGEAVSLGNRLELSALRADGSEFPVELTITRIVGQAPPLFTGYIRDITERKQTEEALRASERRFRTVFENAAIGIVIVDLDGVVVTVNRARHEMLGYTEAELRGMVFTEYTHPDDRARDLELFQELARGERGRYQMENRYVRKDGTIVWGQLTVSLVRDAHSLPQFAVAMVEDVTERKHNEQVMAERTRITALQADIGRALAQSESLEDMLAACAEAIVRHLEGAFARIWTLNEAEQVLELQASAGMYTHRNGPHSRVPVGRLKIGLIAQERKPHLTNRVVGDPRVGDQEWARREGMVAFVGYPLIVKDRLLGVLAMFARHPLSPATLEAMGPVANEIAVGIERWRTQEALRASEEQYRYLFDKSPYSKWVFDPETLGFLAVNNAAVQQFGYSREEFHRMTVRDLCPAQEIPALLDVRSELLAHSGTNQLRMPDPHPRIKKDGTLIDAEITWSRITFRGRPAFLATVVDVTERKRAEEMLRNAHAETEQLLASIASVLIGVNEQGRVNRWNAAAEEAFGMPAEAVIGRSFAHCGVQWANGDVFDAAARCQADHRPTRAQNLRFRSREGDERILVTTITPIRSSPDKNAGFLLLGSDITEHKQLEEQLRQAQKLEAIGQLAAGIAHEINTPIQYVGDNTKFLSDAFRDLLQVIDAHGRMFAAAKTGHLTTQVIDRLVDSVLKADIGYLTEEIPKAIQQSQEGVERVAKIVRAMKEFSHPGTKEKVAIDINKAIENTITVARNEWKYVAEVVDDFAADLPPVPCLPGEFNQVILNLLVNAAHAIEDVPGRDAGTKGVIRVTTRALGEDAEIRVSDTGTGIPEAIRSKVFDPFFTTKPVGKGTGQGLAIAHSVIVNQHGGTIHFETEPGKGTAFVIRLPLSPKPR